MKNEQEQQRRQQQNEKAKRLYWQALRLFVCEECGASPNMPVIAPGYPILCERCMSKSSDGS